MAADFESAGLSGFGDTVLYGKVRRDEYATKIEDSLRRIRTIVVFDLDKRCHRSRRNHCTARSM